MKRGDRIQAEDHVLGARERGCKHLQNSQDLAEMRRWSLKLLLAQDAASKDDPVLYTCRGDALQKPPQPHGPQALAHCLEPTFDGGRAPPGNREMEAVGTGAGQTHREHSGGVQTI